MLVIKRCLYGEKNKIIINLFDSICNEIRTNEYDVLRKKVIDEKKSVVTEEDYSAFFKEFYSIIIYLINKEDSDKSNIINSVKTSISKIKDSYYNEYKYDLWSLSNKIVQNGRMELEKDVLSIVHLLLAYMYDYYEYDGGKLDKTYLSDVLYKYRDIINTANSAKCEIENVDERKLDTLIENITTSINSLHSASNVQHSNLIADDNDGFKAKYIRARLFLDKNLEDPVYLSDVYVQPKLVGKSESLKDYLLSWSSGDTPVLLLCGKAGIGKTSLVSELIINDVFNGNAHAVFLRKKVDCFDSSYPWESIKKAFNCNDDAEYKGKILILDGFDELCVLKSNFLRKDFLENLSLELPDDVKVLITSREYKGYFNEVKSIPRRISVEHIKWSEKEMIDWCNHYSSKRNDATVKKWCDNFKNNYNSLDDKRKDILYTPIMFYICCHENIDISQDKTIVEIYDKAFKNIVTREYSDNELQQETGLSAQDGAVVMWQLIKELAYQMHLNDKLDSGAGSDLIQKAKNRVIAIKNDISLTDDILSKMLKRLPTIFYFATESADGGYEFAHKTVAEYFTAVKIYEDYFARLNFNYYSDIDSEFALRLTFDTIIEAFRYIKISHNIFDYINIMDHSIYNGEKSGEENGFDFCMFEKHYVQGMQAGYFSCVEIMKPVMEYNNHRNLINVQIENVISNLTIFLTGHGYENENRCDDIFYFPLDCADLRNWEMSNLNCKLNIISSNLKGVNLSYSKVAFSNISKSSLTSADLKGADLRGADLKGADLRGADLRGADLSGSDLRGADLRGADLKNAFYNSDTRFSDNFDIKSLGMIEVD